MSFSCCLLKIRNLTQGQTNGGISPDPPTPSPKMGEGVLEVPLPGGEGFRVRAARTLKPSRV